MCLRFPCALNTPSLLAYLLSLLCFQTMPVLYALHVLQLSPCILSRPCTVGAHHACQPIAFDKRACVFEGAACRFVALHACVCSVVSLCACSCACLCAGCMHLYDLCMWTCLRLHVKTFAWRCVRVRVAGSYGGMLATYHRVAKPDVFAAAIAASAPLSFMFGTQHWALTSDRYHKFIAASVDANSHSSSCRKAIRRGFELFKPLGKTQEGRKQLAQTFNLCGEAESVLPDAGAAFALEIDQYNWFEGYAQVNNQPSLMGQVALVCDVIIDAVTAGNDELEALASVLTYLASNGSASWCYEFNATYYLTGPGTYSYQGCTQVSTEH